MEEKLRAFLAKDEKLLWCGRPEPFETLDKTYKSSIVLSLVIKGLITVSIFAAYIIGSIAAGSTQIPILAALVMMSAFALVYPFLTAGHLRSKKIYGLTDRRILRIGENNTESVPYSRIKNAALRSDADGHTSLLCGERTVKLRPTHWRNVADGPFSNDEKEPEAESVVLYALPMDDKLRAILEEKLPLS